jgi:RHS repeat-associated protein
MVQPGRRFAQGSSYRYGFNGKENDKDISKADVDFGARIYDDRIGRWLSVDPLQKKYPDVTPYCFVLNSPLSLVDKDGKDVYIIIYGTGADKSHFLGAAWTKYREIVTGSGYDPKKDHVYVIKAGDLGKLQNAVKNTITDANKNSYGKTVSLSVYSHAGADGPVGGDETSGQYNLKKETRRAGDENQMTLEGWKKIDFNFDEKNCGSNSFAKL